MEHSSVQRDKILSHAFSLFMEKGYSNTTTREIAQESGINKGLLHYYYNKKEDIIFELYRDFTNGLADYLSQQYGDALSGYEYVALLNMLFYKVTTSKPEYLINLSELLSTQTLSQKKIEQSLSVVLSVLKGTNESEEQIRTALTVSVGAEAQLLYGMSRQLLHINYRELSVIIEKIFLRLLDVDDDRGDAVIEYALEECDRIDISSVFEYLASVYYWCKEFFV